MTATPNNPFRTWTAERLILCNFLREKPHTYTVLTRFAGHKNLSLRVEANRLRQKGQPNGPRLSKENVVTPDHPKNLALELFPLPDPPADLPVPHSAATAAQHQRAQDLVLRTLPAGIPASGAKHKLTPEDLIALLDAHILQGGLGRDFLQAIKTRYEMEGIAKHPGPPPPMTDAAMAAELLALLKELPPHVCDTAILDYQHARTTAPLPSPPDADLDGVDEGPSGPDRLPDPGDQP